MKGAEAPFSEIRRTGFAGLRRIFAEVSLPSGSKNSFLSDLPPGERIPPPPVEDEGGRSPSELQSPVRGSVLGDNSELRSRYERQIRTEGGIGGGRISPPRGLRILA